MLLTKIGNISRINIMYGVKGRNVILCYEEVKYSNSLKYTSNQQGGI